MPAARLWRITGIDTWGGGALELSALHLYGSAGRLDATAAINCSHTPTSGTLAALQDSDPETLCSFDAAQVRAPGFRLQWDFGAGNTADVWGLRAGGGPNQDTFLATCSLQYFDGGAWVAAECGAYPWPGAGGLTSLPLGPVVFGSVVGVVFERTAVGSRQWYRVAMSADGQRLAAIPYGGYLYTSADGGATWTERTAAGTRNWRALAMSADGQRLVVGDYGGAVYTSADGGSTWTVRPAAGTRAWNCAAMSADGQKLSLGVGNAGSGYLYTSADYGATWTERTSAGVRNWKSIAMSADGQRIGAVVSSGYIYTSADGGSIWTERTAAGSRNWIDVACSADGQRLVAASSGSYRYSSTDGGVTWIEHTVGGLSRWQCVACSADGQRLIAAVYSGAIHVSDNAGATWTVLGSAGLRNWHALGMSADGQCVVAASYSGYLYTFAQRAPQFVEPRRRTPSRLATPAFVRPPITFKLRDTQTQQLARDTAYGGNGTVYGTVDRKGTPANVPLRRRVRLHSDISGNVVRETWSDATTGAYSFTGLDPRQRYTALAYDHEHNYRAEAADNLAPEVLP